MSNYTPATNFLSKDSLTSGNPLKAIRGSEINSEFGAIQVAVNSKFDGAFVFAPDGSAATPSFGFASGAGVGMYNAAGVLNFATGGTGIGAANFSYIIYSDAGGTNAVASGTGNTNNTI